MTILWKVTLYKFLILLLLLLLLLLMCEQNIPAQLQIFYRIGSVSVVQDACDEERLIAAHNAYEME